MKQCCQHSQSTQPEADARSDVQLAALCKALGHPARIRILRQLLAEQGCVCGRIVEIMPLAQSTVSQHLKVLKKAGLIRGKVEGPATCYCIDHQTLGLFGSALAQLCRTDQEDDHE